MSGYQSPYERRHSVSALVKPVLVIIVILAVLSVAAYFAVRYIMGQQVTVLRDSFSEQEVKRMSDTYHIATEELLTPLYTFEQGSEEYGTHYTGIVMQLDGGTAAIEDILKQCFAQDSDGEMYLTNRNNFTDYFVDNCYDGDVETVRTQNGSAKAIRCKTDFPDYAYFFFAENGAYYLMVRRLA